MKGQDIALLLVCGLAVWAAGTVFYAYRGAAIFETTALRYWGALLLSAVVSSILCVALLRFRHIAAGEWGAAVLLLAIPGMFGEAIVLSNLSTFMPRLHEASGGRYGAFLFATYGLVLGVAEIVTLRVR